MQISQNARKFQDFFEISTKGFLYGFDSVVWTLVIWYCLGGLSVAACIKYANNISKNFATSFAILLSTIGSIYIFHFEPDTVFLLGVFLVIISIFLYSLPPKKLCGVKGYFYP